MQSLSGSQNCLEATLFLFLKIHKCRNTGCKKFSFLKCQVCRTSYYCGRECQVNHWSIHKEKCQNLKDSFVKQFYIPKLILLFQTFLDIFFKEVFYKVFESFYGSLKTLTFSFLFHEFANSPFGSRYVSLSVKKRGIKSQSWNSLKKQMLKSQSKHWNSRPLGKTSK